jgi:hypothetical protein
MIHGVMAAKCAEAGGYRYVSMGPAVFQEIVPCRLVSTLQSDDYRGH